MLFSLERLGMKFGLENISRLCAALGHPERSFQSVLVAGTNGKGSVTAMVHQGLAAAGHHTARYTSPHLERLEERYVIGTREVTPAELREGAQRVLEAAEALQRSGVLERLPTFFECATAIAFELFRRAGVQVAVLEVGLGGRLDATNVVDPVAAAITSIDFDHQAQLGNTLAAIAREKAGVVRRGIPVILGRMPSEAEAAIAAICDERAARLVRARGCVDPLQVAGGEAMALPGAHQEANAEVAACLLRELDALGVRVGLAAQRSALTEVVWPARLERFSWRGTEVLLDAAHNPAGARALAEYLREAGWDGAALVFAAMQDKDAGAMLAELAAVCGSIVCTALPVPRALPAAALAGVARGVAGAAWRVAEAPEPASALARAASESSRVVVAGSIFLAGPARGILRAG